MSWCGPSVFCSFDFTHHLSSRYLREMTAYVNAVRKDGKIERRGYRNQDLINTLASNPSSISSLKVDSASSAALSGPSTNVVPAASDAAQMGGYARAACASRPSPEARLWQLCSGRFHARRGHNRCGL